MRSKIFMVLVLMVTVGLDIPTCAAGDPYGRGSVGQAVVLPNAGRDIPTCAPGDPCGPGKVS